MNAVVAKLPNSQSKGRLSSQTRRSRYESILALINFCDENPKIDKIFFRLAFKRALSRANNYNKKINNKFISIHLFNYVLSKIFMPSNYKKLMIESLKVFSGKKTQRPHNWKTGAEKVEISKSFIKY